MTQMADLGPHLTGSPPPRPDGLLALRPPCPNTRRTRGPLSGLFASSLARSFPAPHGPRSDQADLSAPVVVDDPDSADEGSNARVKRADCSVAGRACR